MALLVFVLDLLLSVAAGLALAWPCYVLGASPWLVDVVGYVGLTVALVELRVRSVWAQK